MKPYIRAAIGILPCLVYIFPLFCTSCNSGQAKSSKGDTGNIAVAVIKKDSIAFPPYYVEFRDKFKKGRNGRPDLDATIPFALMNSFLVEKMDTLFNNGIRPLDWIENRYGEFFIIEVHCVAGGDCATYRLVAFDKNGRFVKMEELGLLAAEEDETEDFDYKILSDTTLRAYKTNYDEEKGKAIDSTSWIVKLKL